MSSLLHFLHALLPSTESQREHDEAYLAGSVDLNELESRMRSIDARGRSSDDGIALGLYTR